MIDPTLIHAYVDGELTAAEVREFESQMHADPALAREVESARQLKASISTFAMKVDCDDAWAGCASRIAELQKVRRTERFVTRNAWALCGGFAFVLLMGGMWHRATAPASVENADFVKMMAGGIGVQSQPISTQRKELNRYLDSLLNEARKVTSDGRIEVLRSEAGDMGGHRATRLLLRDKLGDMILIVADGNVEVEGLTSTGTGHTFLLAGDRNASDLVTLAKSIAPSGS